MAWNTKEILTSHSKPIPQYFNPVTDQYEALLGANGASRHVLYGPDGNPITTTGDKLAVRATEIETLLTNIQGYIDTLEAVLGEAQADPAEYTIQARVKNLEDKLAAITTDGIKLSGSITSVSSPPVVGTKTITATAAEIFAGASVKANRRKLIIRNEDPVLRMRIGPSSVTQQNGYPIEPGATVNIQFDPATAVAIYGISEGAALSAAILEV